MTTNARSPLTRSGVVLSDGSEPSGAFIRFEYTTAHASFRNFFVRICKFITYSYVKLPIVTYRLSRWMRAAFTLLKPFPIVVEAIEIRSPFFIQRPFHGIIADDPVSWNGLEASLLDIISEGGFRWFLPRLRVDLRKPGHCH
jgi:hypothetical protein